MATTWTPIASVVQTTIPNDITGNSLSLAPVSGDSNAVALKLGNGSSTLFGVDASGNVSAAAASLSGTLAVTGTTTLGAASVTSMTNSGQMTAKNAQVSGNGTAAAPAYSFTAQTDTGPYLATASSSAAVLGFAVNGTQALSMTKSGISVPGTLNVTGATTLGNATVGNLTTSGLTNTGSGTAAGLLSSISGTASAPSFSYTNQTDTGLYLATQSASAAVLGLAVNGTQAVSLAKGGVSVPGTFGVTGATTLAGTSTGALAVSGNETVSGTLGVTGATTLGTLSAGASTVTSVATTSLGPVTSPPHTFVGQTDTGVYLPTQSSTAAIMGLAVNGNQSLALSKSGVTVPGTLNVTGNTTLSGNTSFGGTLTSTGNFTANALFASATGSATAPVISNSSYTSTGIYFSSTPALVFTAGGTAVASMNASSMNVAQTLNAQGALAVTGNETVGGTLSVSGTSTLSGLVTANGGVTSSGTMTAANVVATNTVKSPAVTINASGGAITFGDSTTQTTAATTNPIVQSYGPYQIIATSNQGAGIWNFFAPGNATANTLWTVPMPFAGYVLGFSVVGTFGTSQNVGFYISKQVVSGTSTTGSDIITVGQSVPTSTINVGYANFPSSAIAFNATDLLTMKLNIGTATTYNLTGYIHVQFTASSVKSIANTH